MAGSSDALPLATRVETRLPWRPTRGSLTSPSYLVRNRTLGPPLEKPLVLFFLGYYLGTFLNAGGIGGGLGFALGIAIAVVYDRKVAQKENTVHTITGYAGDFLLKSMNKGDN